MTGATTTLDGPAPSQDLPSPGPDGEHGPDGPDRDYGPVSAKRVATAALGAIGIWWASTAILIFLNFIPGARPVVFLTSLGMAVAGAWWMYRNRYTRTVKAAYGAFTAGLLVWAFVEASFYTGYVVGPGTSLDPATITGPSWDSFVGAVQESLWHEIMVIALVIAGIAVFRKADNRFGLYVFLILFFFHQSAKLNVFFGVVNTGEHFLPETVSGLIPFMTERSMNLLFPFSVTINTVVAWHLLSRGVSRRQPVWARAGYILVGTMAALAMVEHWFLVVPMDGTLWDMSLHGH